MYGVSVDAGMRKSGVKVITGKQRNNHGNYIYDALTFFINRLDGISTSIKSAG